MRKLTSRVGVRARWVGALSLLCTLLSVAEVSAQECLPKCRNGFVCVSGACVSACNPVCDAGQSCVNGDCVSSGGPPGATAPQHPPPVYSPPPSQPPPASPAQYGPPQYGPPQYGPPQHGPPHGPYQPPAPRPTPSDDPHGSSGAYVHDGFFLQLGLGVGFVSGTAEPDAYDFNIDVNGIAQLAHLAIGGTPLPSLVLGGGVFTANVFTTKYQAEAFGQTLEDDGDLSTASLVLGFATYYLEPLQQFFLTAGLGAAVLSTAAAEGQYASNIPETSGTGFGAMAGFGFELFVSEQWSVGGMARVLYISADVEDDSGSKTAFTGWAPGLMMIGTYH